MGSAVKFKNTEVPRQKGEVARFKVVQGPDYGSVFVVLSPHATIGRGEESDIVILDLKASRTHAELDRAPQGWSVKDRGSANGIFHNGKNVREAMLVLNDTLTVGETTLEFVTAEAQTQFIVAPPRTMTQVQNDLSSPKKEKPKSTKPKGGGNRLLLVGVAGAALWLLLGDSGTPTKPNQSQKNNTKNDSADLASYLAKPEKSATAEMLYRDGMREYFDGNYSRARTQFETVLQIVPSHAMATLYLENCNKAIDNEVKANLEGGRKSHLSGRLRDARSRYERVMRLLYKDQSNPSYIEARDQMEKVEKEIKSEEDDNS